jgi:anti-sigma B factor antagonist
MITRPLVEKGIAVVGFTRDSLDASSSKVFKEDMKPVIDQYKRILLDLEDLQFVDSSGLGAMLSCLRAVHSNGGQMALCGMSKPVRTLFELVRMHRIFEIYPNRGEAISVMDTTPSAQDPPAGA